MQYPNSHIEFCLEATGSVFRNLAPKEKETIADHHTLLSFEKGASIYREGEKSKGLLVLVSGKAKMFRTGVGGREQILRLLGPGDISGLVNLFSETHWKESAAAFERGHACLIEKTALSKIIRKNAEFGFRMLKLLADENLMSYNRLVSLTQKHVRGRVAESLLLLRDVYGFEDDRKTISVVLSRDDLAHFSNMTTSNAIRTLSNMSTEGIIELRGKRISILDAAMLERISGLG